jgi:uncharacterized protein YkwD
MKSILLSLFAISLSWGASCQKLFPLSDSDKIQFIEEHQKWRAEVKSEPLMWSVNIQKKAEDYALQLAKLGRLKHSNSSLGENLYWFSGQTFSPSDATDSWGAEKSLYKPGTKISNTNYHDFGHYTQMIWHKTTELGCGVAQSQHGTFVVCQYNPPGNFIGEMP